MAKIIKRTWKSRGPLGRLVKHYSYGYDARIAGQRERKFAADWTTPELADAALALRLKDVASGQTRPEDTTLGALAAVYLQYKTDKEKGSIREDRRIVTRQILPAFGAGLAARALTESQIAQYEQRRTSEKRSACTVANELSVLRHMLRLGRKWGYLDQVPEIEMPKKPEPRQRYLEEAEITRLLGASRASRNPYLASIVTVALNTGMRKGEILGLEWARVDLATSRLTLYRTKSRKPRGIPVNRAVYDTLIALGPSPAAREGLVFARRGGAAWGQIRTAFTSALKRAGILAFRFHDLRHTFASHYMMRGGSLYDLKEILGHSDIKMTLRYAHLSPSHLRAGVDRLDGLTGGHIDGHNLVDSAVPVSPPRSEVGGKSAGFGDAPVAQVDRAAVS